MSRLVKVAIIGATGYSGIELVRILTQHPKVELKSVYSSSQDGEYLYKSYPHLQGIVHHQLQSIDFSTLAKEVDFVFTATPTGVSTKLVPDLLKAGLRVIDLSGDFRLKDKKAYKKWYQKEAGDEEILNEAIYGLTEWVEEDLTKVQFVSNPGCFPTAILLGLAPVIQTKQIVKHSIIIDAKTGVSGAGRSASANTHFPETNDNLKIYRVNEHQHTPEIEQMLLNWDGKIKPVTFSTHLVPMTRGIMATMYVELIHQTTFDDLYQLYLDRYKDSYFVRIREKGSFPTTKDVYGSNFCDIGLAYDERTNRMTIVSVIDNLVKGASGQAVQNMNRMLGMDETEGLTFSPIYP